MLRFYVAPIFRFWTHLLEHPVRPFVPPSHLLTSPSSLLTPRSGTRGAAPRYKSMMTDALEGDHRMRLQLLLLIHLYARVDSTTLRTIRATIIAMCPPAPRPFVALYTSALASAALAVSALAVPSRVSFRPRPKPQTPPTSASPGETTQKSWGRPSPSPESVSTEERAVSKPSPSGLTVAIPSKVRWLMGAPLARVVLSVAAKAWRRRRRAKALQDAVQVSPNHSSRIGIYRSLQPWSSGDCLRGSKSHQKTPPPAAPQT
jgi:hypothetical protein